VYIGWLRFVGSIKLGRAAAKLPRAMSVGTNEGDTNIGGGSSGSLSSLITQISGGLSGVKTPPPSIGP